MRLMNSTDLDSVRLKRLLEAYTCQWPRFGKLTVRIRYSRGADFSGTCFYGKHTITVNVGRHVTYPYAMRTYIARAQSNATHWWKRLHAIEIENGYQLALFVFLHEFFHYLIKRAGRNTRQKESMCDRFAARALVDRFDLRITTDTGEPVPREDWDFQDLDRFVAAVWRKSRRATSTPRTAARSNEEQLLLWPELHASATRAAALSTQQQQSPPSPSP